MCCIFSKVPLIGVPLIRRITTSPSAGLAEIGNSYVEDISGESMSKARAGTAGLVDTSTVIGSVVVILVKVPAPSPSLGILFTLVHVEW